MKIISIHRDPNDLHLPEEFVVGTTPIINGEPVEHNPQVSEITFYETGAGSGKAYRGSCYVVAFADSTVRRVIPASTIAEVAYENEKNKKNIQPSAETEEVMTAVEGSDEELVEAVAEEGTA